MDNKVTRRNLAALLAAAPSLLAQAPETAKPQPVDELARATEAVRANSRRLSSIVVPMALEPAMQFKV